MPVQVRLGEGAELFDAQARLIAVRRLPVIVEGEPQPGAEHDGAAGQGQTLLLEREHQRQHQAGARGVAHDGQLLRRRAVAEHPLVGAQRVIERGGNGCSGASRYSGDRAVASAAIASAPPDGGTRTRSPSRSRHRAGTAR